MWDALRYIKKKNILFNLIKKNNSAILIMGKKEIVLFFHSHARKKNLKMTLICINIVQYSLI